jgi:xanthine dehydrogenase accessory factor
MRRVVRRVEKVRKSAGILMRELLAELERVIDRGLPCACCTVVATRGSTPQKAGATMLVFADGTQSGTLGGGCVEAEVRQRALHTLATAGGPELHTFTLDDDFGWDDGLICGGRMTILADRLTPTSADYFRQLKTFVESGKGCTELVAVAGPAAGSRYLLDAANLLVAGTGPPTELPMPNDSPRPSVIGDFALLPNLARITLLIVGGGHVGQAVAKLAAECDFDVWVLDDRETFISAERFPRAARRIAGDIGASLTALKSEIKPHTYALIVTRGHNHDEEALFHLADSAASYVGMIGSKRKVRLIFEELKDKGVPAAALERVRAPVGLSIGSQTVPEIAVSIVAELIARRNNADSVSPRGAAERSAAPRGETRE